jgi:hypothetical protein
MADGRADYRSGAGAKDGAAARTHLTITERLSRTSAKEEHNRECNSGGRNPTFAHKNSSCRSHTRFHQSLLARFAPSLIRTFDDSNRFNRPNDPDLGRPSFRYVLLPQAMNLRPLRGQFPLLRSQRSSRVSVLVLDILHLVADQESGSRAETAADRRPRSRMTDRRANDCTSARAQQRADSGAFLTGAQRLPRTSSDQ